MAVLLFRIDERLIHGQVVLGWGTQLHADRIIVVDDELAASSWEQELYTLGLPEAVEASFEPVATARQRIAEWSASEERIFLLTRDLATMRRLAEGGALAGREVNIGGIHHAAGRQKVLPYVFLGDPEREEIRALMRAGAQVSARDLPGARAVEANALLEGG